MATGIEDRLLVYKGRSRIDRYEPNTTNSGFSPPEGFRMPPPPPPPPPHSYQYPVFPPPQQHPSQGYQSYYQPSQQNPYYAMPPPPPPHHPQMDFWSTFERGLADLTFNSKPIINHLTTMTMDGIRMGFSRQLTDLLLTHLARVPPPLKLPAMYLIDSIIKNVGEPIKGFIAPHIATAFLKAVNEVKVVDGGILNDFHRVLQTWKHASVFPPNVLTEIDRGMPQKWSTVSKPSTGQNFQSVNAPGNMPFPPQMPQLPPSNELLGFLLEALTIARREPSSLPHQSLRIRNLLLHLRIKNEIPLDKVNNIERLFTSNHLSEAFDTAFVLKSQLETGTDLSVQDESSVEEDSFAVGLTFDSIMKPRPGLHRILYEDYPLQCKTCALRFADTEEGRQKKTLHLDSHFRRNMRERNKKVLVRGWFLQASEWITYGDNNKPVNTEQSDENEDAVRATFEILSPTESRPIKTLFGRPSSPAGQEIPIEGDELPCPACLEKIDTRWDVRAEEWVYIGAARNEEDNQVYHFNCLDDGGQNHDIKSDSVREIIINNNNNDNVLNSTTNYPADKVERLGSFADDSESEHVEIKSEPGSKEEGDKDTSTDRQ